MQFVGFLGSLMQIDNAFICCTVGNYVRDSQRKADCWLKLAKNNRLWVLQGTDQICVWDSQWKGEPKKQTVG